MISLYGWAAPSFTTQLRMVCVLCDFFGCGFWRLLVRHGYSAVARVFNIRPALRRNIRSWWARLRASSFIDGLSSLNPSVRQYLSRNSLLTSPPPFMAIAIRACLQRRPKAAKIATWKAQKQVARFQAVLDLKRSKLVGTLKGIIFHRWSVLSSCNKRPI